MLKNVKKQIRFKREALDHKRHFFKKPILEPVEFNTFPVGKLYKLMQEINLLEWVLSTTERYNKPKSCSTTWNIVGRILEKKKVVTPTPQCFQFVILSTKYVSFYLY